MRSGLVLGLAVLLAAVFVVLWTADGPRGPSPTPEPPGSTERPGPERPAPLAGEGGRSALEPARDGAPLPAPARGAEAEAVPEGSADPTSAGSPLRLLVVEHGTERPLADFTLSLRQDERRVELRTDEHGVLTTEPDWRPGEVALHHVPDSADRGRLTEWRLEPWQLRLVEGDPLRARRVVAEPPALVLEVLTLGAGREPLADVDVAAVRGLRDAARGFHGESVLHGRSDATGRVRFGLFAEDAEVTALRLQAHDAARGLASEALELDPPLARGPYVLDLGPLARVLLLAYDRAGAPLARGAAVATAGDVRRAARSLGGGRIREGRLALSDLPPGPLRLRVFDGATGDDREVLVEAVAGQEVQVSVHFDDGVSDLAAAGRVVDEEDRPLSGVRVWCAVPGRDVWTRTGEDGAFALWGRKTETVRLGTGGDVESDAFEPATRRVRFGTRGVVLRRTRALPTRRLSFRVVDGRTGDPPLEGGGVYVYLPPPRAEGGWAWEELLDGRAQLEVKARAGLRYRVSCSGYREVDGELALDPAPEGPATLQVVLEPGFRRRVLVLDAETSEPLAGARIRCEREAVDEVTGPEGEAELLAPRPPRCLNVTRIGYRATMLQLDDLDGVTDVVRLERTED